MLHFELVTPERLVRSEDVHMVTVPGSEGDFGVLEGHAPLMSTIRDGELLVQRSAGAAPETSARLGEWLASAPEAPAQPHPRRLRRGEREGPHCSGGTRRLGSAALC